MIQEDSECKKMRNLKKTSHTKIGFKLVKVSFQCLEFWGQVSSVFLATLQHFGIGTSTFHKNKKKVSKVRRQRNDGLVEFI